MKQVEARALFPNHTLKFSQGILSVSVKRDRSIYATVTQHEDKVSVSVLSRLHNGTQPFVPVLAVSSYANTHDVEMALNAERSFEGLGPAPYPMIRMRFRKSQEQDFDMAIELLAVLLNVGDGKRFRADQMPFLTNAGKKHYDEIVERLRISATL